MEEISCLICQRGDIAVERLKCGHDVCHTCIQHQILLTNKNIECCNKTNGPGIDLDFLPRSIPQCEVPIKNKPACEQKYNWEMCSEDFELLIKTFFYIIGPDSNDDLVKDVFIGLVNINSLYISFKLKKKTIISTMRKIIPNSIRLESLDGVIDYTFLRFGRKYVYARNIKNTKGKKKFYEDFIVILNDMREKNYI